jgi:hypothetical protein
MAEAQPGVVPGVLGPETRAASDYRIAFTRLRFESIANRYRYSILKSKNGLRAPSF